MKKMPRKATAKITTDKNTGTTTATLGSKPLSSSEAKKDKTTEAFLTTARDRFKSIAEDMNEVSVRMNSLSDLKFRVGQQWDEDIVLRRKAKRLPCMTFNRVGPAVKVVTGDQRQNRPSIQINPVDSKADIKTAEIFQGIIRHIEVNSMADIAYDTAGDGQATHGFGYIFIDMDYIAPMSFDKELFIRQCKDPFTVYCGPASEPDYNDMDYAFKVKDYDPVGYKAKYPKSKVAGLNDFTSIGDKAKGWGGKASIRVAEYWYREWVDTEIVQLNDGSVVKAESVPEQLAEHAGIVDRRTTQLPKVSCCVMNGVEKIEEVDWDGMYIPIVPVLGEDHIVDGVRHLRGIVRDARDPQKAYNYLRTTIAETVGLASKSPWIIADGQDKGFEDQWRNANLENFSVLKYKPVATGGTLSPPPQRNNSEPAIQALTMAAAAADTDIKATTSVWDAKIGSKSNETSGKAILARQNQSDVANYIYIDNLSRSIRHVGRILLDLIPHVYDARQIARIIGEDDKAKLVNVENESAGPAKREEPDQEGNIKVIYNIGVGTYDVAIGVGPSYMTRRQEAFEMMTKLVNSFPDMMKVGGDILMRNSDIPGAQELADRLKKVVSMQFPNIGIDEDEGQLPVPPKIMQAMEQMKQQLQQLTQQNQQLTQALQTKQVESQAKLQQVQAQTQGAVQIEQIRAQSAAHTGAQQRASTEHIAAMTTQAKLAELTAKFDLEHFKQNMAIMSSIIEAVLQPGPVEDAASAPSA